MTSALHANKLPLNRKMETSFTCREITNLIMLYTGRFLKEHMVLKQFYCFHSILASDNKNNFRFAISLILLSTFSQEKCSIAFKTGS